MKWLQWNSLQHLCHNRVPAKQYFFVCLFFLPLTDRDCYSRCLTTIEKRIPTDTVIIVAVKASYFLAYSGFLFNSPWVNVTNDVCVVHVCHCSTLIDVWLIASASMCHQIMFLYCICHFKFPKGLKTSSLRYMDYESYLVLFKCLFSMRMFVLVFDQTHVILDSTGVWINACNQNVSVNSTGGEVYPTVCRCLLVFPISFILH